MNNQTIWDIAYAQSAMDCGCQPEDFRKTENVITLSRANPKARRYLPLPLPCDLVSYGSNVVAQTAPGLEDVVGEYLSLFSTEHCFETPAIHKLDQLLAPFSYQVCFQAEYFLPDVSKVQQQACDYRLKMLYPHDFAKLYLPQWSNALCEQRKELDVLGVGAFDGDRLVGFAGCSADCGDMYQIGVDVLPEYRGRGIAASVTSRLALEVLAMEKVPFYCAAWSNIGSVRNAIACGFRPAWAELTAREKAYVRQMAKI